MFLYALGMSIFFYGKTNLVKNVGSHFESRLESVFRGTPQSEFILRVNFVLRDRCFGEIQSNLSKATILFINQLAF